MTADDGWNAFLKLVPAERLAQKPAPAPAPPIDFDDLEQQASAAFDAALKQFSARDAALLRATQREAWQPVAPPGQYQAAIRNIRDWIGQCDAWAPTAQQLAAAGRPAFAARLAAARAAAEHDCATCADMAKAAAASQQKANSIAADAMRDAVESLQRMNEAAQKTYDDANKNWRRNH